MTRWEPTDSSMTVTGGMFIGSAVGQGNTVSNNEITIGDVQAPVSVDDLRNAIAAARDELIRAAEDPDSQAVVRYGIRTIEGELAKDQPQGAEVRSRWNLVTEVLNPLAVASGIVAQITDLITKVFGGS